MPDITGELAEIRACNTTEERVVLALESIADQLGSLVALVTRSDTSVDDAARGSRTEENTAGEDAWENEGGGLDLGAADALGINRTVSHQFEIGGYHYTKLVDAIAEAKRARARTRA